MAGLAGKVWPIARITRFLVDRPHSAQRLGTPRFPHTPGGLAPVCGNLFHHAVEMYLKGYLCVRSVKDLKSAFSHDLVKIWKEFKIIQDIPDPLLDRFDGTIAALHKYEDIRYSDEKVDKGMSAKIEFEPFDPSIFGSGSSASATSLPRHKLFVDEIDSFVEVMFEKESVNPLAFTNSLKEGADTYLTRRNKKAAVWSKTS